MRLYEVASGNTMPRPPPDLREDARIGWPRTFDSGLFPLSNPRLTAGVRVQGVAQAEVAALEHSSFEWH